MPIATAISKTFSINFCTELGNGNGHSHFAESFEHLW